MIRRGDIDPLFHIPEIVCVISSQLLEYFVSDDMFLPADAYPPSADLNDDADAVPVDREVEAAVKEGVFLGFGCFCSLLVEKGLSRWGRVTVKVDDVAPTDSDWMMPFGDASCATLGHVYMAIKASNRIRDHLEKAKGKAVKLRVQKWIKHSPAGEFRCYTKGDRLCFAGQRYPVSEQEHQPCFVHA